MTGAHFNGGRGYDHSRDPRTGGRYVYPRLGIRLNPSILCHKGKTRILYGFLLARPYFFQNPVGIFFRYFFSSGPMTGAHFNGGRGL